MSEAVDAANNIPAIILFSLWWAFLSTLDLLLMPHESGKPSQSVSKPDGDGVSTIGEDSPIAELRRLDPAFDTETFLRGARLAYEAVLQAYAQGDLAALRPLLSAEVWQVFADDCTARCESHETLELAFIGIEAAEVENIEITAEAMEITVLFHAQIVSAERSAAGDVINGDPKAVITTDDLWTFSRPAPFRSDAWVVVATDVYRGKQCTTFPLRGIP